MGAVAPGAGSGGAGTLVGGASASAARGAAEPVRAERAASGQHRRAYVPGLDGIRAIAVLAVLAYHLDLGWMSGGLLGVQVFFVLSGYLITDLLLNEHRSTGRIDLRRFWLRRARRLLPALFLVLAGVVVWTTLFDRSRLGAVREDLPSALGYYSNWWFIYHHVSYFARFGPPSLLGHLWSLAIEEQFYLCWPLALLVGLRFVRSNRRRIALVLLAGAASAVEMGLLYSPLAEPTRVYEGTDTRAFALLAGAALALAWPRGQRAALSPRARRAIALAGLAALAGLCLLFALTDDDQRFLYPAGMVLAAGLSAALIVAVRTPRSRIGLVLGMRPLRWIGRRSYGLYLWSYPVIVLLSPWGAPLGLLKSSLATAIVFLCAALSWRYVEEPVHRSGLAPLLARLQRFKASFPHLGLAAGSLSVLLVLTASVLTAGLAGLVATPSPDPSSELGSVVSGLGPTGAGTPPETPTTFAPTGQDGSPGRTRPAGDPVRAAGRGRHPSTAPAGQGVTAIGDSILIDAAPYLRKSLPGIVIDAVVGQQLYQVQKEVGRLRAEHRIGHELILELGTNGYYSKSQLLRLLRSLGPLRRVILVNVLVARPWAAAVNQSIAAVARSRPDVLVVNWHHLGALHPGYFYPDGVHLDPAGGRYYASLIVKALEARVPAQPKQAATAGRTGKLASA